ncbi:MAG: RHS repeat-associated core domain-containing protein, partial [Burkholderiales bacterium]
RLQNVSGGISTGNTVQSYTYNNAGDITQITGGNINGGGIRSITPSAFSVPLSISQPSSNHANGQLTIQYGYTGDRVRLYEQRPNRPTATPADQHVNLTTYLLAGSSALFEEDRLGAGTQTEPFRYRYKHSINTPEGTVSIVVIDAQGGANPTTTRSDRTFHRDHLGSTVAVTDENGTEFLGYDAWGKRRNTNGQDNNAAQSTRTDRGYTGHEHIDDIGLIHMNGRLYDPIVGRMMSADPIIQAPYLLQNYNRYSYVMNNPLSLTDPSGFSWWTRWRKPILAIAAAAIVGPWVGNQVMWALAPTSANAAMIGAIAGGAAGGFAAGGILGGNIQSALTGAVTGAISGGVATHFGNNYSLARVGAESLTGGVTSTIRGGSFRDGMRSALVFSLVTYGAVKAREFELAHSQRTPGQVGESPGFRGIEGKGAGGRINRDLWEQNTARLGPFDPTREDWSSAVADYHRITEPSALGCHQGGPGCMFGVPYAPNSFRDNVAEAFAGVHDLLNHVPFYNADGTARNFLPQFGRVGYWAGEVISAANVFVAAPIVAVSAVPDELRWIFSERRRR